MRRLTGSLVVAVLAFGAVAGVASATHTSGKGPPKDFAIGTVKGPLNTFLGNLDSQTQIDAQGDAPAGTGGEGNFRIRIFEAPVTTTTCSTAPCTVEYSGEILCINAFGNSAIYHGLVTESNTLLIAPLSGVFGSMADNGDGPNDPRDESLSFVTGPPGDACSVVNIPAPPVTQGNVTIHDGI